MPTITGQRIARAGAIVVASFLAAELALRAAALVAGERIDRLRPDASLLADADVAVYGDSTPFGLGAATSFPTELARLTGLKVVNRSRPGINSSQTYLILRDDLERYAPRIVLVMTGVNDVWNLADVDAELLGPLGFWRQHLPELRLVRMARIWWTAGRGASAFETVKPEAHAWGRRDETARQLPSDGARRITRANLEKIVALTRAKGAKLLFLGYQAGGWNGSATRVDGLLAEHYADRFIELASLFAGDGGSLLQADGFHPTDEGQRRIAERIEGELVKRGLIAG
ncbi:MAG TPA: GDSL-type esterase/lipase family protein [Candidatus Bathyarchaeia archaeon]|nr:GDSL-type esterase/lipase family protein [Candidatus Bathyarchaeia archaeon]